MFTHDAYIDKCAIKRLQQRHLKLSHGKCISTPNYLNKIYDNQTAHMQHFITKLFKVEKSPFHHISRIPVDRKASVH